MINQMSSREASTQFILNLYSLGGTGPVAKVSPGAAHPARENQQVLAANNEV